MKSPFFFIQTYMICEKLFGNNKRTFISKQCMEIIFYYYINMKEKLLIAGGHTCSLNNPFNFGYSSLATSTITFDIHDNKWDIKYRTLPSEFNRAMVKIENGKILLAGGEYSHRYSASLTYKYDFHFHTFDEFSNMVKNRYNPAMTKLLDGRIVIVGGVKNTCSVGDDTLEFYDVDSKTWSLCNTKMMNARYSTVLVLLKNGNVIIIGGSLKIGLGATLLCEIFDPILCKFYKVASMMSSRCGHTGVLLPNGNVFVAGGSDLFGKILASCEEYNPIKNEWILSTCMLLPRRFHCAALLENQYVVVVGGEVVVDKILTNSCHAYDYLKREWKAMSAMPTPRFLASSLVF